MQAYKKVAAIASSPPVHWVGDGFPVTSVFSPQSVRTRLSPYILMDYAGPAKFESSDQPRGVDSHPHRGFETVTVVYQGELEHRDSGGNSGSIGPGDVQWMTAASGVLHEEKHSQEFSRRGGTLEMAQLWVNLPAKQKMSSPRYQTLLRAAIPTVTLPNDVGTVRIIAGDFAGTRGAAETVTPVILWDLKLRGGTEMKLPIRDGYMAAAFVRTGSIRVDETQASTARQFAMFEREGEGILIHTEIDSELLIIGGEPINEPMSAYGPFVMNTPEEIQAAIEDLRAGKFGQLE